MRAKVIGSAAGGGVPQWNCRYDFSQRAREGDPAVAARTQTSLAVSADGTDWLLLDASPDIRQQVAENMELWPAATGAPRSTPIAAIVITSAEVDHVAGLLSLRERQAFNLYATEQTLATLEANAIFSVLDPVLVKRIPLPLGSPVEIMGPDGPLGLTVQAYAVAGKVALYLEGQAADGEFASDDGTIGVRVSSGEKVIHYVPGCAHIDDQLRARIDGAQCLFFDGTVYTDTELFDAGVGSKTGRRMGHQPMSGADGSIAALAATPLGRRIFLHINNTNPVLAADSSARAAVGSAGWEVAHDGMEIVL